MKRITLYKPKSKKLPSISWSVCFCLLESFTFWPKYAAVLKKVISERRKVKERTIPPATLPKAMIDKFFEDESKKVSLDIFFTLI